MGKFIILLVASPHVWHSSPKYLQSTLSGPWGLTNCGVNKSMRYGPWALWTVTGQIHVDIWTLKHRKSGDWAISRGSHNFVRCIDAIPNGKFSLYRCSIWWVYFHRGIIAPRIRNPFMCSSVSIEGLQIPPLHLHGTEFSMYTVHCLATASCSPFNQIIHWTDCSHLWRARL